MFDLVKKWKKAAQISGSPENITSPDAKISNKTSEAANLEENKDGRVPTERFYSSRARRSTRISMRLPVRITILSSNKTFKAMTSVVNSNGARFECETPLAKGEEVMLYATRTAMTAKGIIVWATPKPNADGICEFAVKLTESKNLFGVHFPREDFRRQEEKEPNDVPAHAGPSIVAEEPGSGTDPEIKSEEASLNVASAEMLAATVAPELVVDLTSELPGFPSEPSGREESLPASSPEASIPSTIPIWPLWQDAEPVNPRIEVPAEMETLSREVSWLEQLAVATGNEQRDEHQAGQCETLTDAIHPEPVVDLTSELPSFPSEPRDEEVSSPASSHEAPILSTEPIWPVGQGTEPVDLHIEVPAAVEIPSQKIPSLEQFAVVTGHEQRHDEPQAGQYETLTDAIAPEPIVDLTSELPRFPSEPSDGEVSSPASSPEAQIHSTTPIWPINQEVEPVNPRMEVPAAVETLSQKVSSLEQFAALADHDHQPEEPHANQHVLGDRLSEVFRELIRFAVQTEQDIASEGLVRKIAARLEQAGQAASLSLGERAESLLSSQSVLLENRATQIVNQSQQVLDAGLQRIADAGERALARLEEKAAELETRGAALAGRSQGVAEEGLRRLTEAGDQASRRMERETAEVCSTALEELHAHIVQREAKLSEFIEGIDQRSRLVEQETSATVSAALENLERSISQKLPSLEDQFLQQCRSRAEELVGPIVETAQQSLHSRMDELQKGMEWMTERIQNIFANSSNQLEQSSAKVLAETANRLEAQMETLAEFIENTYSNFTGQISKELEEKQNSAVTLLQQKIEAMKNQSVVVVRDEIARVFVELSQGVANSLQKGK